MTIQYVLDENNRVVEATEEEAEAFWKTGRRRIGLHNVGRYQVSTVFTGRAMGGWDGIHEGFPLLAFETIVFDEEEDSKIMRQVLYRTYEEAADGHRRMVDGIREIVEKGEKLKSDY